MNVDEHHSPIVDAILLRRSEVPERLTLARIVWPNEQDDAFRRKTDFGAVTDFDTVESEFDHIA